MIPGMNLKGGHILIKQTYKLLYIFMREFIFPMLGR